EHRASSTRAAKMTRVAAYHNVRSLRPADRTHHRAQPDLMAVVGHELRRPLAALVGSADLVTDVLDDLERPQLVHVLAPLEQRARGLQVLVDNLMHHSSTGQLKLSCEPLQVANLLADVRLTVEPLLARKEQSLQVIGTADDVVGDRARLVQVLVNLILNASKFSATGASIELEFNVRGSTVWCQVADRGIGLPPCRSSWLFEPAPRTDASCNTVV